MNLRPVLFAMALGAFLIAPPVLAQAPPVVAAFEPDSSDLSDFPLPNHLLFRDGRNAVPGGNPVNALSGFSTAAPIHIPFRGTIDPTTVTEESVLLLNSHGERHAATREVTTYANGDSLIRLEPSTPLPPGAVQMVFVTEKVRSREGARVRPSEFLVSMRSTSPLKDSQAEARRQSYAPVWKAARERLGLEPSDLIQAFSFRTQPIGDMLAVMRARVQKTSPTFTLLDKATTPAEVAALYQRMDAGTYPREHVGMVFRGTLTSPLYVEEPSTRPIRHDAKGLPIQVGTAQVPFLATLPAGATGPVPVLVFSHGSYRQKEDLLRLADAAAQEGLGVIGIDAQLHGERSVVVDGKRQHSGTNLINLDIPIMLRDNWRQTYNDMFSLVRMIQMGRTDFTGAGPLMAQGPMGLAGQSMGGMLTATFTAVEPAIAVSVANVPGGKVRLLLLNSGWFRPRFNAEMARRGVLPVTPAYDQFVWMYQTLVDDSDPFNYGPALRERTIMIQEMAGEDVMPNVATEALARSIGLPQVHPVRFVAGLQQKGWPFTGSALFQFPYGGHNTMVDSSDGPITQVQQHAMRYIATGLRGKAEGTVPELPIPDLHLNMELAPGE